MRFKKILSLLSFIAAIGFGTAGFLVSPLGELSESVLILIAQLLTASGTFIGLDVYLTRFFQKLQSLKQDKDLGETFKGTF